MTLSINDSTSSYYAIMGDSYLAQSTRVYQLVTGQMPSDIDYSRLSDGYFVYSFSENSYNQTVNTLYQEADAIQTALGAMNEAGDGLERVKTRVEIIGGLASMIKTDASITDIQRAEINTQINNTLEEIQFIAQNQAFDGTPVLNGELQSDGVYLNLVGNNSIDITDAFNNVYPESLGLPHPGEAYVRSDNADSILENVGNALNILDNQTARISNYVEDLEKSFGDIKSAIYSTSVFETMNQMVSMFPSNEASYMNGDLYLTMGNIVHNISIDNSYYERIMGLLN
jgi:prefoldin subunit 5